MRSNVKKFEEVCAVRCRHCYGENLSWNLECNRCGRDLECFDELSLAAKAYRRQQAIDLAVHRCMDAGSRRNFAWLMQRGLDPRQGMPYCVGQVITEFFRIWEGNEQTI